MKTWTKPLFAPDERADKCALHEKGEHAFHGQRLPDDRTRIAREVGPVGPELKFHRNAGDDTHGEIESENFGPKSSSHIVLLIPGAQRTPLPVNQKPGQPHGELGKQVVIRQREAELKATPESRIGD